MGDLTSQRRRGRRRAGSVARVRLVEDGASGDPRPDDVRGEHGRFPGSRVNADSLGLPGDAPPVTLLRESLAAYSCGVSSGIAARSDAPDSLLSPDSYR